jgi:hypothetical protein
MTTEPNRTLRPGVGRCTRRTFLLTALLGLTACASGTGRSPIATASDRCVEPEWLEATVRDRQAAVRIGRAYLDVYPDERRCNRLVAEIEKALKGEENCRHSTEDSEQTRSALQALVRKEYARSNVVAVEGWVLSRTEARVYGLAAMSVPARR